MCLDNSMRLLIEVEQINKDIFLLLLKTSNNLFAINFHHNSVKYMKVLFFLRNIRIFNELQSISN